MKHNAKSTRRIALVLGFLMLAAACLAGFYGCTGNGDSADTSATRLETDAPTGPETDRDAQTGPDNTDTDAGDETAPAETANPDTDADTEAGTEPETTPDGMPDDSTLMTFYADMPVSTVKCSGTAFKIVSGEAGEGASLYVCSTEIKSGSHPRLTFDYAAYARACGLEPVKGKNVGYIVIKMRVENGESTSVWLRLAPEGGSIGRNSVEATYAAGEVGSQYLFFDATDMAIPDDACLGSLSLEVFRGSKSADEGMYIEAIAVADSLNEAFRAAGMTDDVLGAHSSVTVEMHDPVTHTVKAARDEDPTVSLWFDHISEKTAQNVTASSGLDGYTVQLAKNEIEDCQFFLSPKTDRNLTVTLTDFTDAGGHTLTASLLYEYYTSVRDAMTPDALPPVSGPLSVKGGTSQGFVIKVKTVADTPAGLYAATLSVTDADTGKEVRCADVYVRVYNFALSDETYMRSAFEMLYWKIYHTYPEGTDTDQLALNYYNFLLDNRICASDLPFGVREGRSIPIFTNPRVNSFRVPGFWDPDGEAAYTASCYEIFTENNVLNKAYFYRVDEPLSLSDLRTLANKAKVIADNFPGYRMVSPCYTNIAADGMDQIEWMKPYLSIWCYKLPAFTPRRLGFLSGAAFLQTEAQDREYGEFYDRMLVEMAEGDELWAYFTSATPSAYAGWMAEDDGIGCIVSLWQCKLYGVTGILYWGVNAWNDRMLDDITLMENGKVRGWGDGILLYSGAPFGIEDPVSSLRLENIRDGIEDYQYLCMLEEALGEEAAMEYVNLVTTSVLNYTHDDGYLAAVRVLLGEKLESVLNNQ